MNITDALRQAASLYDVLVKVLDTISQLTATPTDDTAVEVLKAIGALVTTARAGMDGEVTLNEITQAIADLQEQIAQNDASADAALHEKFDVADVSDASKEP